MSRSAILFFFGAVGGLLLVDCGSDAALLTADRFPSAYAQALCGSLRHCCDENAVTYNWETCTSGWKAAIEKRLADPVALSNYDARVATSCVSRVRSSENASCGPLEGSVSDAREVCMKIFVGKKPVGASCASAAECAPPPAGIADCEPKPGAPTDGGTLPLTTSTPPVCVVLNPPVIGDKCVPAPGPACGDEGILACEPASLRCVSLADVGASCLTIGCRAGSYCSGGLCRAKNAAGAPCASAEQCDGTTRCDLTGSKVCVARNAAGIACAADSDCLVGACDPTTKRCLKNSIATTAACTGVGP